MAKHIYKSVKMVTVNGSKQVYKKNGYRFTTDKNEGGLSWRKAEADKKEKKTLSLWKKKAEAMIEEKVKWVSNGKKEFFTIGIFSI